MNIKKVLMNEQSECSADIEFCFIEVADTTMSGCEEVEEES
ncbi:MAG: hypothetical protein ACRCWQ_06110 [Bacilli bacterium]